jgi:hypothetical protein
MCYFESGCAQNNSWRETWMLETLPKTRPKQKDRAMDPCGMKFASLNNIL